MPTVLREKGFRVMVYLEDHAPPHVHVVKDNAVAIYVLEPVALHEIIGSMSKADVAKAKRLIVARHDFLKKEWNRING